MITPEEIKAAIAAKAKPPVPHIDNTERVTQFRALGGRILHIPEERAPNGRPKRGVTAAFIVRSGRIEIATGVQHRGDSFTKKIGTKTAIEHFLAGKTMFLPLRGKTVNFDDLKALLTWLR